MKHRFLHVEEETALLAGGEGELRSGQQRLRFDNLQQPLSPLVAEARKAGWLSLKHSRLQLVQNNRLYVIIRDNARRDHGALRRFRQVCVVCHENSRYGSADCWNTTSMESPATLAILEVVAGISSSWQQHATK